MARTLRVNGAEKWVKDRPEACGSYFETVHLWNTRALSKHSRRAMLEANSSIMVKLSACMRSAIQAFHKGRMLVRAIPFFRRSLVMLGTIGFVAFLIVTTREGETFEEYSYSRNNTHDPWLLASDNVTARNVIPRQRMVKEQIPSIFIQSGLARTASTLQFQSLCLFMAILHPNAERIDCRYVAQNEQELYSGINLKHPLVIKMHVSPTEHDPIAHATLGRANDGKAWHFVSWRETTRKPHDIVEELRRTWNRDIRYVQTRNIIRNRGYRYVQDYQDILGLNDGQMDIVLEYLRYWTILRKCCGLQMSSHQLGKLATWGKNWPDRNVSHPAYPDCAIYDMKMVTGHFLQTRAYRAFGKKVPQLTAVSNADLPIYDGYCEEVNNAVKIHHPDEVGKCFKSHPNITSARIHCLLSVDMKRGDVGKKDGDRVRNTTSIES